MTLSSRSLRLALVLLLVSSATPAFADSVVEQWMQGLGGTRLTLDSPARPARIEPVVHFCPDGRYRSERRDLRPVTAAASGVEPGGASGRWWIERSGSRVLLRLVSDTGEQDRLAVFRQDDGRVNVAGVAYAPEFHAAGC